MQLTIEKRHIDDIKPYENNPRVNEKAIDAVVKSIQEFGFRQPIVVDANSVIICGHTRWQAARQMGLTEVPVHVADDLTPEQIKAYRIADNKTSELSDWDYDLLPIEISDLDMAGFDLSLLGFADKEIVQLLDSEIKQGLTDPDEIPDVPEDAITQPGDIWLLGEHRLLCGDATNPEDIKKLMNGKKAHMVFTDPPYNVDYGSSKNPRHKIRKIENDSLSPDQWEIFCKKIFRVFKEYNTGDIYMWGASGPDGMRMRLWLVEAGCHWSATVIWKKQQLVLSPANYQRMYEPCFYGWFDKSSFVADRKQTEVWEFDRPLDSKLHPTMKPVELCAYGIANSSQQGQIVLDLFLGSGSTLIACVQTDRICYGTELDPAYCDVIVKRWEEFTGQTAERITSS